MHTHSVQHWQYDHNYLPESHHRSERRTRGALALTFIMMVVELVAGYRTGSLALVADGWHMGSHVAALGISAFAYAFSRHHVNNARFTFGTGKVSPLAGYTSALTLAFIAVTMVWQAITRLFHPIVIYFDDAILVAVLGLLVNLSCAIMLGYRDEHDESHPHHHDHNLRSAYVHVLTDALTSLLAIVALVSGKYWGFTWMDPVAGIIGALIIAQWCAALLRSSARVLLDAEDNTALVRAITERIEGQADNRIADLHVWRLGPLSQGCIVSLLTHEPRSAEHYKQLLADIAGLKHVTIEVNLCCHNDAMGNVAH